MPSPPFAAAPLVVVIEVGDDATDEGVRRAIKPALYLRDRIRASYGYHGPRALLEVLLTEIRLGIIRRRSADEAGRPDVGVYQQLAYRVNSQIAEAVHQGDMEAARGLLKPFIPGASSGPSSRRAQRALVKVEQAIRRAAEADKRDCAVAVVTHDQVRNALHSWERSRHHKQFVRLLRDMGRYPRLLAVLDAPLTSSPGSTNPAGSAAQRRAGGEVRRYGRSGQEV